MGKHRTWSELDAIARTPGDDATDHIMRHGYGVDPDTYRATHFLTSDGRTVSLRADGSLPAGVTESPSSPRAPAPKKRAAPRPARRSPAPRRSVAPFRPTPRPKLVLSRLVRTAIKESPSLASTIDRLVASHLRKGIGLSRVSFIGFPLTIISTSSSVRVAFASER